MKHIFRILAILTAAFAIAACNSDKKNIEKAAYGYLNATGNYLTDEAKPYATPKTHKTLQFLKEVLIPLTDTSYITANTPAEITINNIEIANDTALVYYTKVTPLKTLDAQITVIKFDGKWLVDLPLANESDTTSNLTLSVPAAPNIAIPVAADLQSDAT